MTIVLRLREGPERRLTVDQWHNPATSAEIGLLARLSGPVLDLGCGPGRLVVALAGIGVPALGIDASPHAVRAAISRGAPALCRSVFDPLPAEGRWRSVLLLDGNIGIGGDPVALLRRTRQLMIDTGTALVEVDPPGGSTAATTARIERDGSRTAWFPWASVAAGHFDALASRAGFRRVRWDRIDTRWFATIQPLGTT